MNNIILIEPIFHLANYLIQTHPNCLVIPCGLGSTNSIMDLHLASNGGESSSVLKPLNHITYYPDVTFDNLTKIPIRTFESLIDEYKIDGDFIESQAFAYLAIRVVLKLPISFPGTTLCKTPCIGGELIEN